MQQRRYTVSIARGEGLVARFGDVLMYIADTSAAAAPLIEAAEAVSDMEFPGAAIAERLAPIAFHSSLAFGVVAPTADGLLVLLRGNVVAAVDAPGGAQELSGSRALTWVDEIVPTGTQPVAVGVGAASGLVGCAQTDLRAGVVPGGGFVLEPGVTEEKRPEPAVGAHTMVRLEPAAPAPSPAETAAARVVSSPAETRASPVVSSPADTAAAQAVPPHRASTENFKLPSGGAFLVSDDGDMYPLDRTYVIGRDPQMASAVRNNEASPIVVEKDRRISRVHVYVSVDGDTVFVRDAATPAGTHIAPPGSQKWTQIGTTPSELKPGWSIQVGEEIFTYRVGNRR